MGRRPTDITHSTSRLSWGMNCLVSFAAADVPELIARSNDVAASHDVRNVWFTVGIEVTFRGLRGRARIDALAALAAGPDNQTRRTRIAEQRASWMAGAMQRRDWKIRKFVLREMIERGTLAAEPFAKPVSKRSEAASPDD